MIKLEELPKIFEGFWTFIGGPILNFAILLSVALICIQEDFSQLLKTELLRVQHQYRELELVSDPLGIKSIAPVIFWFLVVSFLYLLNRLTVALLPVLPVQIQINVTHCLLRTVDPRTLAFVSKRTGISGAAELVNLIAGGLRLDGKGISELDPGLVHMKRRADFWRRIFCLCEFYLIFTLAFIVYAVFHKKTYVSAWAVWCCVLLLGIMFSCAIKYWETEYWYYYGRMRTVVDYLKSKPGTVSSDEDERNLSLQGLDIREKFASYGSDRFWLVRFHPIASISMIYSALFKKSWVGQPIPHRGQQPDTTSVESRATKTVGGKE